MLGNVGGTIPGETIFPSATTCLQGRGQNVSNSIREERVESGIFQSQLDYVGGEVGIFPRPTVSIQERARNSFKSHPNDITGSGGGGEEVREFRFWGMVTNR